MEELSDDREDEERVEEDLEEVADDTEEDLEEDISDDDILCLRFDILFFLYFIFQATILPPDREPPTTGRWSSPFSGHPNRANDRRHKTLRASF